jgi:hypothetical protein
MRTEKRRWEVVGLKSLEVCWRKGKGCSREGDGVG